MFDGYRYRDHIPRTDKLVTIVSATIAILLAVVIGFATHRASLCNVRAVGELLSSRRAYMLASFAKTVLWVVAITMAIKSFSLEWRVRIGWLRNLMGGILMGVGVTLTPGGNDVLILHSIPSGSPHALPAYGALLVGTAAGLIVVRSLVGDMERIECTADVCRTRPRGPAENPITAANRE